MACSLLIRSTRTSPLLIYAGMCGRFTHRYTWREIYRLYSLTSPASNVQPNYNVCPTDPVNVATRSNGKNILEVVRWGLVPQWWSKPLKGASARHLQRARQNYDDEAVLQGGIQTRPMPDPRVGLTKAPAVRRPGNSEDEGRSRDRMRCSTSGRGNATHLVAGYPPHRHTTGHAALHDSA
jgi:hypothetical protein